VGSLVARWEANGVLERIASLLGRLFHRFLLDKDMSNVHAGKTFRARR
jgi:hypothetical protein